MGIFDIFRKNKSKSENQAKSQQSELNVLINSVAFAGGQKQEIAEAEFVCEAMMKFNNAHYDVDSIISLNRYANALYIISGLKSSESFNSAIIKKGILDEAHIDYYNLYLRTKYDKIPIPKRVSQLIANLHVNEYMHKVVNSEDKVSEVQEFNEFVKGQKEGDIQEIFGRFGYDKTNPICATDIIMSKIYFIGLRLKSGEKIEAQRTKGVTASNVNNIIDEYAIYDSSGNFITHLYISPYQNELSTNAPDGFRIGG